MSFRSLIADLVLGGNLANAYSLSGTITIGDPTLGHIVLDGTTDAILIYEAANTLMISIAPSGGVTERGTHYPAGFALFDFATQTPVATWDEPSGFALTNTAGQSVSLTAAPLNLVSGAAPAGTIAGYVRAFRDTLLNGYDSVVLQGPISAAATDSALSSLRFALSQGNAADGAIAAFHFLDHTVTALLAQLDKTGFNIKAGSVTAPHPGGAIGQSETWQTPAVNANWTTTGTTVPLRYRKEGIGPNGTVRLDGEILTTGAGPWPANATMFSLPAGYHPAQSHPFITRSDIAVAAGQCTVNVLNSGGVQNGQAFTAAGQRLWFDDVVFPLD